MSARGKADAFAASFDPRRHDIVATGRRANLFFSVAFQLGSLTLTAHKLTAIDIWPAEITDEPENLEFEFWNLNDSLTPTYNTNHYEFIHSRCVAPGIKKDRWGGYVRDLVRLLKRDGWLQMVEYHYIFQSDCGRLNDDHAIQQWGQAYRGAMEVDRDPRVGRSLADKLRAAGLHDIHVRTFHVPVGTWPTGT